MKGIYLKKDNNIYRNRCKVNFQKCTIILTEIQIISINKKRGRD